MGIQKMTAAAIAGNYAEFKLVKTRGVFAITIEFPVERTADVFAALGYPQPGTEIPVAVARLNPMTESEVMPADCRAEGPITLDTPPSSQTLGAGAQGSSRAARADSNGPPSVSANPVAPEGDENRGVNLADRDYMFGPVAQDRAPRVPQTLSGDAGARPAGDALVKRAGILCKEPEFQRFMGAWPTTIGSDQGDMHAASNLRTLCQIASRRDLAHDEAARERFKALLTEYDLWRGRLPEPRG